MPADTTDPGVLLYFASGHLVLNGSAQLTAVRAMDHGPYAGLLYWQVATSSTTLNSTSAFTGGGWRAARLPMLMLYYPLWIGNMGGTPWP